MATKSNLAHLGMPVFIARALGQTPVITSVGGATAGIALPIAGDQFVTMITASNSGSGLKLPQVGGDWSANAGAMLGDEFKIFNALAVTIQIYIDNNALGSAVTIYANGVSAAGTTGVSLPTGQMMVFIPITVSTWFGGRGSA